MIEKIYEDLYRIEIPLPDNPLVMLNSYLICSSKRNLLIDTGFNTDESKAAINSAMAAVGFSMENTDIFITHAHSDHAGLAGYLSRQNNVVYCGAFTAKAFKAGNKMWDYLHEVIAQSGLDKKDFDMKIDMHIPAKIRNMQVVFEGDILCVGRWNLRCINTSGHAPDHFCLYDEEKQFLFSGDHILAGITPNITLWDAPWECADNPLMDYLENLDKIAALHIERIFPAHREIIENGYRRIQELKEHNARRIEDILEIIGNDKVTGAETASRMHWDIKSKWIDFPPFQKLFAVGEALSHLTYLVCRGVLKKELGTDGIVYYSRVN